MDGKGSRTEADRVLSVERIVLTTPVGAMNAYLLHDGRDAYVVDPGGDRDRLVRLVRDRGLSVRGLLLTHAHVDHIGALDVFPVPVRAHPLELALLLDPAANGVALFGEPLPFDPAALDLRPLAPGETLPLGDGAVSFLHTPGHTAGSVCYRLGDDLFAGDTLFAGVIGRWDFPTGDGAALRRSVLSLVDGLPGPVRVLPGHGPSTTIAAERSANPYVQSWRTST